ncbi:MAG: hypothetical protein RIC55_14110 [Pirellulaceae bacterium]
MTRIDRHDTAWIHESTVFAGEATVGHCSRVGHDADSDDPTRLGNRVRIGAFCLVYGGAKLGDDVEVDNYCLIGSGAKIACNTRILYKAHVYDDVTIGRNCIIGGDLVDRAVIGDNVTFQGQTAHAHPDATGDWDETEEPSPRILSGSVVGVGAIIVGDITIGPRAYVAAGEIVRCNVGREMMLKDGQQNPLADYRGMFKVRDE